MLTASCVSVATVDESDAQRLKRLVGDRNQAAFAREIGLKGGPSMLSQHMSGNRPIALEAGLAYAIGLGVPLRDISPRLEDLAAKAAETQGSTAHRPEATGLGAALPVVLAAISALPPARWASVRAQLEQVTQHPEMRDDVLAELQHLLAPSVWPTRKLS